MGYLMARHSALPCYVPGTHEEGTEVVRLNTNESPYPPSPGVAQAVAVEIDRRQFYNDPDCPALRGAFAKVLGVQPENVLAGNGSDEVLYWAFMAFADETHPIALPDVTYSYYDLFAAAHGIPLHRIPLRADFSVNPEDYLGLNEMIVLANPNAPTGLALSPGQLERIARSNPHNVLIVDEAYVDCGWETCLPLIGKYENLLVTRTFSKSRCLAGGRLGYAFGSPAVIADLEKI